MGKTLAMEKAIAAHIRKNPKAVIFLMKADGDHRVEKPVEGEVVGPLALPAPTPTRKP